MMSTGTFGRVILLLLLTISGLYYLRYWHKNTKPSGRAASYLCGLAACCLVISNIAAIPQPPTLFLRLLTVITFHQGVLFIYFGIVQSSKTEILPFYTTKLYLGSTLLLVFNLVLEWLRHDNLGSFIDNQAYRPDAIYFASYALFYGQWLFMSILLLLALKRFMQQSTLVPYRLRIGISLAWGWLFLLCAVLAEVNLGLSLAIGDAYRAQINQLYHALKVPIGFLQMLSAAPVPLFIWLSRPIEAWTAHRQMQHRQLIHRLHSMMIQIAPHVHLPNESLRDIRAQIEIGDARDVIWSHYPRVQAITPRDEAKLLCDLLDKNVTLTTIGQYQPQETRDPLPIHNLKVAKLLQRGKRSV
jgi:hypothetical protein